MRQLEVESFAVTRTLRTPMSRNSATRMGTWDGGVLVLEASTQEPEPRLSKAWDEGRGGSVVKHIING